MFSRQWFPEGSQIGLSQSGLFFKQLLEKQCYDQAERIVISECSENKSYWRRQYKRLCHLRKRQLIQESEGPQPIKIYFSEFWPGMDPENCQLLDIIVQAVDHVKVETVYNPQDADVSLFTCYGSLKGLKKSEHTLRLLFLGENVRPSYEHFDISLTSDQCSYYGLNSYLPLWLLEIDWFGKQYPDRRTHPISLFTEERSIITKHRKKEIVYIGNNNEPFRTSTLRLLRDLGLMIKAYGQHSNPVEDKIRLCNDFIFNFCPENSYYPGYVTEKLMHAYISGCIPIYWGCLDNQPFETHPMILRIQTSDSGEDIAAKISRSYRDINGELFTYPRLAGEEALRSILCSNIDFIAKVFKQFE